MKCPVCKSENIKHKEIREDNDVCGPGYCSWVVDEYEICQDCGIMFKNVEVE